MEDWLREELEKLNVPITPTIINTMEEIEDAIEEDGMLEVRKKEIIAALEHDRQVITGITYHLHEMDKNLQESELIKSKHPKLFEYLSFLYHTLEVLAKRRGMPKKLLEKYVSDSSTPEEG